MEELTIEILRQIRDELRGVSARVDGTNERLDRVVQEQIRHATAIVALEGRVADLAEGQRSLAEGQRSLAEGQHSLVEGQRSMLSELIKLNGRIDNVLTRSLGATVRGTSERVDALEVRMDAVEKRIGSRIGRPRGPRR